MNVQSSAASARVESGRYLLLSFAGTHLLLDHRELVSVETLVGLTQGKAHDAAPQSIAWDDIERPLLSLSAGMRRLDFIPAGHRYVVLYGLGEEVFALTCEETQMVAGGSLDFDPLPGCMHSGAIPIESYAKLPSGGVGFLCPAKRMRAYLVSTELQA